MVEQAFDNAEEQPNAFLKENYLPPYDSHFCFRIIDLGLQLLKARTEDSKGERNLISKQAGQNVNEKGRLEQAIEREPHVELH